MRQIYKSADEQTNAVCTMSVNRRTNDNKNKILQFKITSNAFNDIQINIFYNNMHLPIRHSCGPAILQPNALVQLDIIKLFYHHEQLH